MYPDEKYTIHSFFILDKNNLRLNCDQVTSIGGLGQMVSILEKLFTSGRVDAEDDALGCDMVPSPSVLAALYEPQTEPVTALAPSSDAFGPFTTMARAPIRES